MRRQVGVTIAWALGINVMLGFGVQLAGLRPSWAVGTSLTAFAVLGAYLLARRYVPTSLERNIRSSSTVGMSHRSPSSTDRSASQIP
jgi:hypothetical protein